MVESSSAVVSFVVSGQVETFYVSMHWLKGTHKGHNDFSDMNVTRTLGDVEDGICKEHCSSCLACELLL